MSRFHAVRLFVLLAPWWLAGCSSLAPRPELPQQVAVATAQDTQLDQLIGAAEAEHPGQSGFRLVREGPEAFAIRSRTALAAGRSLDIQTYIWHDDVTGGYLAYRALEAADRGVKVRLLVDDMDARGKNYTFAALDAHPNIEVRMFNPFGSRTGSLRFAFEAMGSFSRINRRMHNKSWIVDNRIAIVGGRNLGDEYFGASDEINFVDLDFAHGGPDRARRVGVVRSLLEFARGVSRWRCLHPKPSRPRRWPALRERVASRVVRPRKGSDSQLNCAKTMQCNACCAATGPMQWTSDYRFVADDPAKAMGRKSGLGGSDVLAVLAPIMEDAKVRITVISPYFVPGKDGTKFMLDQVARGYGGARADQLAGGERRRRWSTAATRKRGPNCWQAACSSGS